MDVTLEGIVTVESEEQSANASSPIVVTPDGISTLVRLVQLQNEPIPML